MNINWNKPRGGGYSLQNRAWMCLPDPKSDFLSPIFCPISHPSVYHFQTFTGNNLPKKHLYLGIIGLLLHSKNCMLKLPAWACNKLPCFKPNVNKVSLHVSTKQSPMAVTDMRNDAFGRRINHLFVYFWTSKILQFGNWSLSISAWEGISVYNEACPKPSQLLWVTIVCGMWALMHAQQS